MEAPRRPESNVRNAVLYLAHVLLGLYSAYVAIKQHFSMSKGIGLAVAIGIVLGLVQRTLLRSVVTVLTVVAAHLVYLYIALH